VKSETDLSRQKKTAHEFRIRPGSERGKQRDKNRIKVETETEPNLHS
jgi:hypothetical protein